MKLLSRILCVLMLSTTLYTSYAQCATASMNWDALDYIPTAGYTNTEAIALSPRQYFAFGKNRLYITYSGVTSTGENAGFTGIAGSYGAGENVQYTGNGTITLTFATAVTNLKFSWYDNDKGQVTTFAASNSGTPTPVTLTKANAASTDITVTNTATNATVTSSSGNTAESSNNTSVNVDVAGPVTSVTMTISLVDTRNGGQADANYWLSDISACVTGSFPTNYYAVSRPFGTMPSYVLMSINSSVYMVDPATGNAKFIFMDGATSGTINSLAYDPYNRIIYYTWSLTNNGSANASERTLRKYDMNTGTATIVLQDIRSLGIPTFDQGVESGAAAFYDGALYLGIEGGAASTGNSTRTSTYKESIIWRLDFTNGVPTSATEVYAVSGDTHDWSDFSINNGVLYDANGDAATPDYHHLTMQTGANLLVPYVTTLPKQTAVGWDGTVYYASSSIGVYNLAGGVGTLYPVTSSPAIANWSNSSSPSFGDGGEAFRPQADFGDAPATYDPDPLAPAVHEINTTLKLGLNEDVEWTKPTVLGTAADAEGTDDDGLTFVRILNLNGSTYQTDVNVFNNSGTDATLAAWVDFNNDGVFQASEGIVQTVATGTTMQTKSLYWTGITSNLPANSNTYLRIRITSAANSMTTANATGYFSNGEVEDYYVLVNNSVLAVSVTSFSAKKAEDGKVAIQWKTTGEEANTVHQIERSDDGRFWKTIYKQITAMPTNEALYTFTDVRPAKPVSYYRLKYNTASGSVQYSRTEKITFSNTHAVQVYPNPTFGALTVLVTATRRGEAVIALKDGSGKTVITKVQAVEKGTNTFVLTMLSSVPAGLYTVVIATTDTIYTEKVLIQPH